MTVLRHCLCGADLDRSHVLCNLLGIQRGADGRKIAILFHCRCRTTLALHYHGAPADICRAADQIPLH